MAQQNKSLLRLEEIKDLRAKGLSKEAIAANLQCTIRTVDRYYQVLESSDRTIGSELTVTEKAEKRTELSISLFEAANELYSTFLDLKEKGSHTEAQKYIQLYMKSVDKLILLFHLSAQYQPIIGGTSITNQIYSSPTNNMSEATKTIIRQTLINMALNYSQPMLFMV